MIALPNPKHPLMADQGAPRAEAKARTTVPTPDGRYLVVDGRLWRASRPDLAPQRRQALVDDLMRARRDVGAALRAQDAIAERAARARVHEAKVALGERGPPWWDDAAPDYNRKRIEATPYAAWWAARS